MPEIKPSARRFMPKRRKSRANFKRSGPSPKKLLGRKTKSAVAVKPKYIYGGLALAAAVFLLANEGFRTIVSSHLQLRSLNAEMARLESEEVHLKARIDAVQTNDAALERVVRKELGYRRPGEIEYRFPPPSPKDRFR